MFAHAQYSMQYAAMSRGECAQLLCMQGMCIWRPVMQ